MGLEYFPTFNIYHKFKPHVGKYSIHGAFGNVPEAKNKKTPKGELQVVLAPIWRATPHLKKRTKQDQCIAELYFFFATCVLYLAKL